MPIQFVCPSCSQPIEVDDEFADRQVVCPYCESVVAAPARSNLEGAHRPNARAVDRIPPLPPGAPPVAAGAHGSWQPPIVERNRFGNWALMMSILGWVFIGVLVVFSAMIMFAQLPDGWQNLTQKEQQDAFEAATRQFVESPDMASKRAVAGLLQWIGIALGLVGMILAIVGVTRRNARKGTSIAALVISLPMLLCIFFTIALFALKSAPAA